MLCVKAANIEKAVTLKPGEEWKGRTCPCWIVIPWLHFKHVLLLCRGRETT